MDVLIILRTFAAVTTVLAAALVAANLNARVTVLGFVIATFIFSGGVICPIENTAASP
jgi:hypothetical protein